LTCVTCVTCVPEATAAPPPATARDAALPGGASRRSFAGAFAAAALALGATACSAMMPPLDLRPPTVRVSDVAIDSLSLQGVRFTLKLATHNPNAVDIPLSNLRFDLALFGQQAAHGSVPEQRFTLPARGDRVVPVVFDVASSDVNAMLRRLASSPAPEAIWEVRGSAHWGSSPFPISFDRRGDLADLEGLRRLRELLGR
jgi:LEA14-like dessication related protein